MPRTGISNRGLVAIGENGTKIAYGWHPGRPFGEESRDYPDHPMGGKTPAVETYGPDRCKGVLTVWAGPG